MRLLRDTNLLHSLAEELNIHLHQPQRSTAIHPVSAILATLAFCATGTYQRPLGEGRFLGMSQQSMSKAICMVTNATYNHLAAEWIVFPTTFETKQLIKRRFMEKILPRGNWSNRWNSCVGSMGTFYISFIMGFPTIVLIFKFMGTIITY
ncbi:uncharacterized protein LOC123009509 [Tribolium madens]|uniref:uncharacterized protein LOC123009509 n=1 Tax=Tribolium madens TaxID=41895 RepID=UPI001CF73229|nr:uncharacterized protein LOC123009509 [Tribolium madens]